METKGLFLGNFLHLEYFPKDVVQDKRFHANSNTYLSTAFDGRSKGIYIINEIIYHFIGTVRNFFETVVSRSRFKVLFDCLTQFSDGFLLLPCHDIFIS